MVGIYIENSSGEPLTVFDHAVNSVQEVLSVCYVCAMPLLDTARDSQSVLELHADASAQFSTALQTVGGYAGNT